MLGNAPNVTLALDSTKPYTPGATVVITATMSDIDDGTEVLTSVDELGREDTITIQRHDAPTWVWSWKSHGATISTGINPLTVHAPAASDTIVCTVTDGQGHVVIAEALIAVQAPISVGVTPDTNGGTDAVAADLSTFKTNGCARVYSPGSLPQWTDKVAAALHAAGATLFFSAKTADLASYVSNWDNIPADVDEAFYIFQHECNKPAAKTPPALAYVRAFYVQLLAARKAHKNAAKIKIGPCFSWYPAAVTNDEGTPWRQWIVDGIDFIGWDAYNVSGTKLEDPTAFASLPIASGKEFGKPVIIGEFGVHVTSPDTNAAAWLPKVVAAYEVGGVTHLMYWNSGSYKLNARPAPLKAWQAACN